MGLDCWTNFSWRYYRTLRSRTMATCVILAYEFGNKKTEMNFQWRITFGSHAHRNTIRFACDGNERKHQRECNWPLDHRKRSFETSADDSNTQYIRSDMQLCNTILGSLQSVSVGRPHSNRFHCLMTHFHSIHFSNSYFSVATKSNSHECETMTECARPAKKTKNTHRN